MPPQNVTTFDISSTLNSDGEPITTAVTNVTNVDTTFALTGTQGPSGIVPGYFDVMDYGATGNGSTDDTTSIQSAISAAAVNGGIVYFPAGTYLISAALTLVTGVSMQGLSSEVSIINQSSTTADAVDATDAASISISELLIEGPSSGTGVGINLGWSSAGNVPFLSFTNLKVHNFGSDGIAIETPIVSNFNNVVSQGNGGYGFNFYHAGTSCTFNNCWARDNAFAGYHFYESVYMNLSGCASDGNGVGYLVENAQSIGFYACGCESTVASGGDWDGTAFKISNSSVCGIYDCWVTANNAIGVWITDGSIACEVFGAADNSPGGSATAFVQTDVSTNSTLSDIHNTTANSYSAGTVTILNDGANGLTTRYGYFKGANGTLTIDADTDGGQYNFNADTTGTLAIYGAGGQTLGVHLLDGLLTLDAGIKLTSGTPGSGKVLTSDSAGVGTWQTASSGFTNPMTTLGDIIYGASSGTATRLAGSTSATIGFLSQTGTGSASAAPVWTSSTGTGNVVLASSPTLVSPTLGAALATSINGLIITSTSSSATLDVASGVTATFNHGFTLGGSNPGVLAFGGSVQTYTTPATSSTLAGLSIAQTWSAVQTFTNSDIKLLGSSTGATTFTSANSSSSAFTLTFPAATDTIAVLGTAQTWTGTQTFNNATFKLAGTSSGTTELVASSVASGVISFPAATDTVVVLTATQTLSNKTFTAPSMSTIVNTGTLTLPTATDTLVARGTTDTLTNKRVTPRVVSVTQSATPAMDTDNMDVAEITSLAQAITSMTSSLTGTPTDGQELLMRISDNGTGRAITWGSSFISSGVATLLATTIASKIHTVGLIWDASKSAWVCLAVDATGY